MAAGFPEETGVCQTFKWDEALRATGGLPPPSNTFWSSYIPCQSVDLKESQMDGLNRLQVRQFHPPQLQSSVHHHHRVQQFTWTQVKTTGCSC
ncbi:Hypothetical protein SMAX5B_011546 [Scophthalmus maximus]|uniref:Uncharacterized protein n=1 Tax=Scophthalmus maximus TaxID=52904 RepID=A0A2U9BN83_SCOMX|nr:Hypothetical protein SMAX5B_011546 [Scophthalmus maximus]